MEAKLRKAESILAISGMAVVAFGVWDVVSAVVSIFLIQNSVVQATLEGSDRWVVVFTKIFIIIIVLISLGLRTFIGLTARSFGRGKDKGIGFLIVTAILMAINIIVVVLTVMPLTGTDSTFYTKLSDTIVNLTSLFALLCLFIAGIRVRVLRNTK